MKELLERITRLFTRLDEQERSTQSFLAQLPRAQNPAALAREFGNRSAEWIQALRAEVKEVEALARKLVPGAGAMKPEALARHFRTLIEKTQQEALDPQRGPIGATLRGVDLEVRGLIVVEGEELRILTPTPDRPVDPGQLSTVRMSFGSAPVLRTQTEGER